MFNYKTIAEIEMMDAAQKDTYATEKRNHEAELVKQEAAKQVAEAVKELPTKADIEALKEVNRVQGETITELKEKGNGMNFESLATKVSKFIKDNHEQIKEVHKSKTGLMQVKVVGDVTTASGTNTAPPSITGVQQAPLSNVNLRDFSVTQLTNNIPTNLSAYPYTEAVPKDGDYAFLLEGGIKPQIDFSWETNYAKPVKSAAWVRLTDESVQDVAGLQSLANDFLRKKHDLKKSKGILFGDGISPNPKGATVYGCCWFNG